jgi:hypothetical protein
LECGRCGGGLERTDAYISVVLAFSWYGTFGRAVFLINLSRFAARPTPLPSTGDGTRTLRRGTDGNQRLNRALDVEWPWMRGMGGVG